MKPYGYQEQSIEHLLQVLKTHGSAINGSDTGTGKTLVAVETMKRLGGPPTLVVCPKAVIPAWHRTATAQGTDLDCLNFEMLRTGRTPYGQWSERQGKPCFRFHPAIKLLFIDEAHRCKGYRTKNSLLLKAARQQNIPTVAMSATLADTPMEMDALGYMLRLHDSDDEPTLRNLQPTHFCEWARGFGCGGEPFDFHGTTADMARLNSILYPARGVRVRIDELGDLFPETQITAELYDLEEPGRLDAIYAEMAEARADLKRTTDRYGNDPMAKITAMRQEAELLKVPVFVSLAQDAVAQGMSVAIFVNYRRTLAQICQRLGTECTIDGSQIGEKGALLRERNRVAFQQDKEHVIVTICEAGGVGIDLHDIIGKRPRLALVSPGFCAKTLRQVFGRVHRAGGKSKSLQRVIFASNTIEEGVHASVSRKLNNLDALNDGDLDPMNLVLSS